LRGTMLALFDLRPCQPFPPPTPLFLDTLEFHMSLPLLRLLAILGAAILSQAFTAWFFGMYITSVSVGKCDRIVLLLHSRLASI